MFAVFVGELDEIIPVQWNLSIPGTINWDCSKCPDYRGVLISECPDCLIIEVSLFQSVLIREVVLISGVEFNYKK